MQNYDLIIERISKLANLDKEEVERRVEAKKAKLSGLISKEGAAQIIAAELGISFEDQDLKINELMTGMRKVNIIGKIISLFPVREYSKNGREGKVVNFILADETSNTRAVLWDVNHIGMIESGEIKQGDVIEIRNASTKENEVHLSSFSELKKSNVLIKDVKTESVINEENLEDVRQGQNVKIRGVVVQIFQPRFYSVCPECNKKVVEKDEIFTCAEHGAVIPKGRAILNFVLDDGTENMRVVLFSEQINALIPEEELRDEGKSAAFRDSFIGTEIYLSGIVKRNQLFNNLEIVASGVERVDVEKLIEKLNDKK